MQIAQSDERPGISKSMLDIAIFPVSGASHTRSLNAHRSASTWRWCPRRGLLRRWKGHGGKTSRKSIVEQMPRCRWDREQHQEHQRNYSKPRGCRWASLRSRAMARTVFGGIRKAHHLHSTKKWQTIQRIFPGVYCCLRKADILYNLVSALVGWWQLLMFRLCLGSLNSFIHSGCSHLSRFSLFLFRNRYLIGRPSGIKFDNVQHTIPMTYENG